MTYNPIQAAGDSWTAEYSDLLLSFDRSLVNQAMRSFIRTEMAQDIATAEEDEAFCMLNVAFVKLYQRHAIEPIRPLSAAGESLLAELLQNFNVVPGPLEEDESLTLREQVIQDWNTIGMDAFKKKRQADAKYEAMYARLAESGDIT